MVSVREHIPGAACALHQWLSRHHPNGRLSAPPEVDHAGCSPGRDENQNGTASRDGRAARQAKENQGSTVALGQLQ